MATPKKTTIKADTEFTLNAGNPVLLYNPDAGGNCSETEIYFPGETVNKAWYDRDAEDPADYTHHEFDIFVIPLSATLTVLQRLWCWDDETEKRYQLWQAKAAQ